MAFYMNNETRCYVVLGFMGRENVSIIGVYYSLDDAKDCKSRHRNDYTSIRIEDSYIE